MDRYVNMFVNMFLRRVMAKGMNAGFKAAEHALSSGKSGHQFDEGAEQRALKSPKRPWVAQLAPPPDKASTSVKPRRMVAEPQPTPEYDTVAEPVAVPEPVVVAPSQPVLPDPMPESEPENVTELTRELSEDPLTLRDARLPKAEQARRAMQQARAALQV